MPQDNDSMRGDLRPIPDPTILTTQQLTIAIASLKELTETRIEALEKQISERFSRGDERFKAIGVQFTERDIRNEQATRLTQDSFSTALQSFRDLVNEQTRSSSVAIAKAEAATDKQLSGLDGKISDLKDRLTIIEGKSLGQSGLFAMMIGGVSLVLGIIAIFAFLQKPPSVERVVIDQPAGSNSVEIRPER